MTVPDINPGSVGQQYTPRRADLVDALADVRRVSDATVRANPLRNAVVDDGLMRWRGKYGDDFLWVGEILPADPTDGEPQRAFVLNRDDPIGAPAFSMYDFAPQPGGPLRQRVVQEDADGRTMFREGTDGGVAWPYTSMSVFVNNAFEHDGAPRIKASSIGTGSWRPMWRMSAPLTGPIVRVNPVIVSGAPAGQPFIQYDLRLQAWAWTGFSWESAASPIQSGSGTTTFQFIWDLMAANLYRKNVISYVIVSVEIRFTSIPGWWASTDAAYGYCDSAFIRGSTSIPEPPLPPD